jgi:hypothetical protein
MTTTYCTLFRLGYWCSVDAKIESEPHPDMPITHSVDFDLINKFGDHFALGFSIISEYTSGDFGDENGETFPSLDAAIRVHAQDLLRLTPMPGKRVCHPPRHETWQGTVTTVFEGTPA